MKDARSEHDDALVSRAYDLAANGDHREAIAIYSDLISRYRVNELFHQRGLSFAALGEFVSATEDFTTAIELDHSDPDSYFNRGNVYLKLKSYDSAIDDFNVALGLLPDDPKMLNSRGVALAKSGRLENGLRDLLLAVRLDSSYASARFNLAILYYETGELNEALDQLDTAAKLRPDDDTILELRRKVVTARQNST